MASILKGAPVVAAMNERNAALCEQLKAKSIVPTLAVVRVGAREDDLSYERGVMTRCGKVGVEVKQYLLPADAAQDDLLKVIAEINADDAIHGCLLFRPLPKMCIRDSCSTARRSRSLSTISSSQALPASSSTNRSASCAMATVRFRSCRARVAAFSASFI